MSEVRRGISCVSIFRHPGLPLTLGMEKPHSCLHMWVRGLALTLSIAGKIQVTSLFCVSFASLRHFVTHACRHNSRAQVLHTICVTIQSPTAQANTVCQFRCTTGCGTSDLALQRLSTTSNSAKGYWFIGFSVLILGQALLFLTVMADNGRYTPRDTPAHVHLSLSCLKQVGSDLLTLRSTLGSIPPNHQPT